MRSKYFSTKTKVGDILFASKKEALRYGTLTSMDHITDLEIQPKFMLIPHFGKERATSYTADFMYMDLEKGVWVIEDVKGFRTDIYRIKKKLFLYQRYSPSLYKFGLYNLKDGDFDLLSYETADDSKTNFRFQEV
jgi:hypothetical protein